MDDLKQLASQLLEIEKNYLCDDLEEYSCAIAVVITAEGRYYEEAEFNDVFEKESVYGAIVERAKLQNATAIITINTARYQDVAGELGSYWWGKLATEKRPKALCLTISGPGVEPVGLNLPFAVENSKVIFGPQTEFEPSIVNLLPGWP